MTVRVRVDLQLLYVTDKLTHEIMQIVRARARRVTAISTV